MTSMRSMMIPTLCSVIDDVAALTPVDTTKAHPARLYDYYLGGKDNYAARVAYIDNDPVVTRHSQALRATNEGVVAVFGDIRRPDEILAHPGVGSVIDFTEPVAVLTVAVLHFIPDADEPSAIVKALVDRMAPGSYVALSHITGDDAEPGIVAEITAAYQGTTAPAILRSAEEITALFGGLELVKPGRLVDVSQWRPERRAALTSIRILAGVARKS